MSQKLETNKRNESSISQMRASQNVSVSRPADPLQDLTQRLESMAERVEEVARRQVVPSDIVHMETLKSQVNAKISQIEKLVYDFRQETFLGIYEVEKEFISKNDQLRRTVSDLSKQVNLQNENNSYGKELVIRDLLVGTQQSTQPHSMIIAAADEHVLSRDKILKDLEQ